MKIFNRGNQNVGATTSAPHLNDGVKGEKAGGKPKFFAFAKDIMSNVTSLQLGNISEMICDRIGLPESVGDVMGAITPGIGAGEHLADLVKDIAARNGNEKLAGFCEKHEERAAKVNKVMGKIGFIVASTVATGGAGGVLAGGALAGGAAAGGTALSIGSASVTAGQIFQGIGVLNSAVNAGDAMQKGDKLGAAASAFGALGGMAGMGDLFGMTPETAQNIGKVAKYGASASGWLQNAKADDGQINAKDLTKLPVGALLSQFGPESASPTEGGIAKGLLGALWNNPNSGGPGGPSGSGDLISTLANAVLGQLGGEGGGQFGEFFGQSMQTGAQSPQLANLLMGLFSQIGHASSAQSVGDYQGNTLIRG